MECQIVPVIKNIYENNRNVKKQRNGEGNKQHQKKHTTHVCNSDDENSVYILQPMFKAPKSTKEITTNTATTNNTNINNSNNNSGIKQYYHEEDRITFAVSAISDTNKFLTDRSSQFNDFTMSRKGSVKTNGVSRVEDPFHPSSPQTMPENRRSSKKENNANIPTDSSTQITASDQNCLDSSNRLKIQSRERMRRASAGDVLIRNNSNNNNKNNISDSRHSARSCRQQNSAATANSSQECPRVVSIGPDEVLLIPRQRRPSEPAANAIKRRSSGKQAPMATQDGGLTVDNPSLPRRKSFHDWSSMQEWYLPETRPVSSDLDPNTKRNVISPCTLSRLLPNGEGQDIGQGVASISVCTEGDRMSYNFNLPSRRLVSHRALKNYSLPYSDNIGLEETVSSDQARRVSKGNQATAIKKKYETDRQTPKQVWHRTVRSILAANHLYHSVKRKNKTNR